MHLVLSVLTDPDLATTIPMIVRATVPPGVVLTRDEIRAILSLAFLSAEIDLDEDDNELELLASIGRQIWQLSGYEVEPIPILSPLPLPEDDEERTARIRELTSQLGSRGARELAYAIAFLCTVSDLELAPVESAFVEELRREMQIEDQRAAELTLIVSEILTPDIQHELRP